MEGNQSFQNVTFVFSNVSLSKLCIWSLFLVYQIVHLCKQYGDLYQEEVNHLKFHDILASNLEELEYKASLENIESKFISPSSPHFGLWEAGIKSTKYHLKRVMANDSLNYEDFCTLLAQIVLNSRPFSPLSSDPIDFSPLTPAQHQTRTTLAYQKIICHDFKE